MRHVASCRRHRLQRSPTCPRLAQVPDRGSFQCTTIYGPHPTQGGNMERRGVRTTTPWFVFGISVLISAFSASGLWARPMDNAVAPSQTCTLSNVASSYGLAGSGTIVSNPFDLPEGPVATVGILTFDGQGHWVSHRSTNGHG